MTSSPRGSAAPRDPPRHRASRRRCAGQDDHHRRCVDLLTGLHLAGRSLLLPAPVTAEVGYLLAREAGAAVESLFLRSVADGDFQPVDLTADGYARMAGLVDEYGDLPLGTTDAAVIALAERLAITEAATLGRRRFTVVRRATRPR